MGILNFWKMGRHTKTYLAIRGGGFFKRGLPLLRDCIVGIKVKMSIFLHVEQHCHTFGYYLYFEGGVKSNFGSGNQNHRC